MTTKHALSDDWRIAPSQNQPIDLANALRSIRKVIAAVDTRNCEVSFNSQEDSHFRYDEKNPEIRIDPRFALTSSPIQGNDFDVLAGLSIHEALHSTCDSNKITPGNIHSSYSNISRIGEEIYIDNFGKRHFPVLGKYIHLAREGYKPTIEQITWDSIFTTWTAISVYGIMPSDPWLSETKKIAQLQLLMELSSLLISKDHSPAERQSLYEETAKRLEKMLKTEEIQEKLSASKKKEPILELEAPQGMITNPVDSKSEEADKNEDMDNSNNDSEDGEDKTKSTDSFDSSTPNSDNTNGSNDDSAENNNDNGEGDEDLESKEEGDIILDEPDLQSIDINDILHPSTEKLSTELINSINEVLELGIEDMSEEVSKAFGVSGHDTIIWSRAKTNIDKDFNQALARQLVCVKDYKNTQGHQVYRNEPRGRVDGQRIYKAPINGLIFKKRVTLSKSNLDLVMLLDASISMSDNTSIYDDAKALHQALPDSVILSYCEELGIQLTEHTDGRVFRKVVPHGGTPTAKALAATALRFPRSLIIHFTDGECDRQELEKLIPEIHIKFPKLKMVHVQLRSQSSYRSSYAYEESIPEVEGISRTVMMENIMDFPVKLKEILREW